MTRVDFYILPGAAPAGRARPARRPAAPAPRPGHPVYIHTQGPEQAAALDDLLWTFRDGSFVPHQRVAGDANLDGVPVLIGHAEVPEQCHTLLNKHTRDVPSFFSRFERVLEPVDQREDNKLAGRERFRFYRDRGYALEIHTLSAQTEDE